MAVRTIHTVSAVPLLWCGVFAAALAARLAFVIVTPYSGGDWALYSDVANNMLRGCGAAITVPGPTGCAPHFGGNQLPLFPGFVASVWYVVGPSNLAIRIVQSVVASASCAWLAFTVFRLTQSRTAGFAAGGVVALSAVQAYWAGSLLTETLALAATQWVLAELLLSFVAGRLRIVPVGIAMVAATWTRMDSILLFAPVAVTAFATSGAWKGLRAALLAALIAGVPSVAWAVRNVSVGINPFPTAWVLPDGTQGPLGYRAWLNTWVVTQRQRSAATFFGASHYERIEIDPASYRNVAERASVEDLLAQLRTASGEKFPPGIDAAFRRLAEQKNAEETLPRIAALNANRAWELMRRWVWPWTGSGDEGRAGNSPTDFYRFALTAAFLLAALVSLLYRIKTVNLLTGLAASYLITRVAFFAITANIEARYMVEIAPFLEISAGSGGGLLLAALHRRFFRGAAALMVK